MRGIVFGLVLMASACLGNGAVAQEVWAGGQSQKCVGGQCSVLPSLPGQPVRKVVKAAAVPVALAARLVAPPVAKTVRAVAQPVAKVVKAQPVRSVLRKQPVRSFLKKKLVRSFVKRVFCRRCR